MSDLRAMKARIRESLKRLFALPLNEGALLILTHDNPDPDCIASSAAMRYLLKKRRNLDATTAYSGIIGRAENRAMVRLLDLPMKHVREIDFDQFRYIALIDAQPRTGNTAVPEDRNVDIVIDHHPLRELTKQSAFYEVSEELGATATLLTEYLRTLRIKIPRDLATALLYGIRSETQDLGREVSELDLIAYEHLVPLADPAKLAAISRPPLEPVYFVQLARALSSMLVGRRVAVCRMDQVNDPDFVPEMADLLARMHGIEWTLSWGIYEGRLYVSIRTNDQTANSGDIMQEILVGLGRGGGHGMRAGGAIDLSQTSLSAEEIGRQLMERFLSIVGESPSGMQPFDALVEDFASSTAGHSRD